MLERARKGAGLYVLTAASHPQVLPLVLMSLYSLPTEWEDDQARSRTSLLLPSNGHDE